MSLVVFNNPDLLPEGALLKQGLNEKTDIAYPTDSNHGLIKNSNEKEFDIDKMTLSVISEKSHHEENLRDKFSKVKKNDVQNVEDTPKKSKRRWLILLIFFVFSFGNGSSFITFAPTLKQMEIYYDRTHWELLQLVCCFMYSFIFLSFPVAWMINKWFRKSMILGMLLQAIGGWVRYSANNNFTNCLIGQILLALAIPFTLATPAYIGHTFFAGEESTIAILIGTYATFSGTAFGIILPTIFIKADQTDDENARGIELTLLIEAIYFCAPLFPAILFMKNRPHKIKRKKAEDNENATESEEKNLNPEHEEKADLTKDFAKKIFNMAKNWRLFVSTMAFGMGFGLALTIQAVISTILPETFTLLQVGTTGVIFVGSGLLFGVFGHFLLKTSFIKGHYDYVIRSFFLVNTIILIFIAIFLKDTTSEWLVYLFNAIGGFGLIAFVPFGIQSLIESAHPIPEIIPSAWMLIWGQVFGIIGTYGSIVASKEFRLWVLVIMLVPASIWVGFFHHTDYKQTGVERNGRRNKRIEVTHKLEAPGPREHKKALVMT
jgi:hypothetical protein